MAALFSQKGWKLSQKKSQISQQRLVNILNLDSNLPNFPHKMLPLKMIM